MEALPLFVYGTLLKGSKNQWARRLWRGARDLGPARVAGRLYSLGRYPGWRPSAVPGEWVHGQLVLPAEGAALYGKLDEYEGRDFKRRIVIVRLKDGSPRRAWIYEYLEPLPSRGFHCGRW